jgi:DNA-directed RNA polymerase specialized sigma24 family protein
MDDFQAESRTLLEGLEGRQRLRDLVRDLQALPDRQRTALLLREVDGLTYNQIAIAMGTTLPGVKSLLVRAHRALTEGQEPQLYPAAVSAA